MARQAWVAYGVAGGFYADAQDAGTWTDAEMGGWAWMEVRASYAKAHGQDMGSMDGDAEVLAWAQAHMPDGMDMEMLGWAWEHRDDDGGDDTPPRCGGCSHWCEGGGCSLWEDGMESIEVVCPADLEMATNWQAYDGMRDGYLGGIEMDEVGIAKATEFAWSEMCAAICAGYMPMHEDGKLVTNEQVLEFVLAQTTEFPQNTWERMVRWAYDGAAMLGLDASWDISL